MADYQDIYNLIDEKITEGYQRGYNDGLVAKQKISLCGKCDSLNEALIKGREEAWKLASKIGGTKVGCYETSDLIDIFNTDSMDQIFDMNVQDVIAKAEYWKEKQKQDVTDIDDSSIKVGDEVRYKDSEGSGIVTSIYYSICKCVVLWKDGSSGRYNECDLHKTGRHFTSDLSNLLSMLKSDTDSKDSFIEADNLSDKYVLKAVTRGNCMICGKELTEGIFFCKECEKKGESEQ